MNRVFIAVGSNVDPEVNVHAAICALAAHMPIVAISTVYRSEPEGRPGQPWFYNCVVEVRTEMSPQDLKFHLLRRIEADLDTDRLRPLAAYTRHLRTDIKDTFHTMWETE